MIREVAPADAPAIEAFLAQHAETSMFLRSNLAGQGVGLTDHPHSSRYWCAPATGAITGVVGLSRDGFAMLQIPGASDATIAAFAAALAGEPLQGLTGEADQAARLLAALPPARLSMNDVEPLYRLELSQLAPSTATIRPPQPDDLALLSDWFTAYARDTGLSATDAEARARGRDRAEQALRPDATLRLLLEGDQPVAMAALNARVADMVQVGGVYVPTSARNTGRGRRVTQALLAEAAATGARTAILFANNPAAARAYEGLGFTLIGQYRVAMMATA
ncbi:GNAT family N-acetyltransferase [Pseudooceanicola spongiae]|uniref:GNAT family N-acetyltransferase n=1 Tax=Pseudooceanicola spongiae TaxID=2613965 RepID=A0A7L9WTX9_9RHOB|nr:GNAT family N-acetyltransferase [Pseudooceanicola spongiae]QOL82906.1 GNAT family N-acetyltransferase [Pseudooceanicola spongiae]